MPMEVKAELNDPYLSSARYSGKSTVDEEGLDPYDSNAEDELLHAGLSTSDYATKRGARNLPQTVEAEDPNIETVDLNNLGARFRCKICGEMKIQRMLLVKHMQTEHYKKAFQCEMCLGVFNSRRVLSQHFDHVHRHPATQMYMCSVCNKEYESRRGLELHAVVHTGNYKFNCELCDKGFVTKQTYQAHMNTHQGIIVNCHKCGKTFAHQNYLKQHIALCSKEEETDTCPICGRRFKYKDSLNEHIMIHVLDNDVPSDMAAQMEILREKIQSQPGTD